MKTGLFSSIIATFIGISLPQLSPDPNAPTVVLLTQLVNNNGGVAGVPLPTSPAFKAPASIVRVNVLWFLSLILSLSCALLATLMQQWARRYIDYAQHRGAPRKQARIRAYMFEGVQKFRMSQAVEAMPLLLHTSVFLFFAGLIEFLFTINNAVARYTLGCVAFFASIYAVLTLLPNLRLNCPYRTPLSWITYYSFQLSGSSLFWVADTIEGIFHGFLLDIWRWFHRDVPGSPDHGPTKWRDVLEEKVGTYYERLKHSLRWRVVDSAMEAPSSVDKNALHWTLTTLDENQKFEEFAARMPGFFDSSAAPDATSAMLSLMSDQSTSEPILGSRLRELLYTCTPGAPLLTEYQRKNRLHVCLKSLWHCVKAYDNLPEDSGQPLAPYFQAIFASPEVIRWIQTEKDLATRLLGRCFWSLIFKKLANDIASRLTLTHIPPTTAELACLSSILDATGEQVWRWLDHKGAIDLANVTFLASGELETLINSGTKGVPADVMDVFQHTLGILAKGMFSSQAKIEWDKDQVAHFHRIYFKLADAPLVPDVLKERLRYISDRLPKSEEPSYVEEPQMLMPSPEPYSGITPFPCPSQMRVGPVRTEGAPDSGIVSTPIATQLPHGTSNLA